jgi:hypothetical protein
MSFWATSDGKTATGEVQENNFDPLPDGYYPVMEEEIKINEYQGKRTIQMKTRVIGEGFGKNRVLFLKLNAFDDDEKKRDRAINLLVKLANTLGVALPKSEPDDTWLSKLTDKPHQTKLQKFDFKTDDGKQITGNFIANFEDLKFKPEVKDAKPVKAGPVKKANTNGDPQSINDVDFNDAPF